MNHLDQKVRYYPDVCESNRVSQYCNKCASFHCSYVLQPVTRKCIEVLHCENGGNFQRSLEKRENTCVLCRSFLCFLDETPNARIDSPPSSHIQTSCLNTKNGTNQRINLSSERVQKRIIAMKQNPISILMYLVLYN